MQLGNLATSGGVSDATLSLLPLSFEWDGETSTIPPREWIYGTSLLRGSVSLLIAPGASGKTSYTAGLTAALLSGRPLLGKRVHDGPKKVWMWNLEDSGTEMSRLLGATFRHWGIGPELVNGGRLALNCGVEDGSLTLASGNGDGFAVDADITRGLIRHISNCKIDVVIVDPFVSSHQCSENDNVAIDAIAKTWSRIAVETSCAVLLVHHTRKLSGAENTVDASRGASALPNAARSVLAINKMTPEEANQFGVDEEQRRFYFRVYDDKNNRAPPAGVSDWFKMESVALGNGRDGKDGDHMPVVVPWSPPDAFSDVTDEMIHAIQKGVGEGNYRSHENAQGWVGELIGEVVGFDVSDRKGKAKAKKLFETWRANGLFKIEEREDKKRMPRPFVAVGRPYQSDFATVPQ